MGFNSGFKGLRSTAKKIRWNADTNSLSMHALRTYVTCTNLWFNVHRQILTVTA